MIYAAVHIGAGHNAIFFLLCDFMARLGEGLNGSCLYQMIIISYSVIEIFSSCNERRALL